MSEGNGNGTRVPSWMVTWLIGGYRVVTVGLLFMVAGWVWNTDRALILIQEKQAAQVQAITQLDQQIDTFDARMFTRFTKIERALYDAGIRVEPAAGR